jgi:hypothetical protein
MRFSGRWLPVLALVPAFAAAPARAEVSATVAGVPVLTPKALPRFGVMADAGLPDGANASLVFRPLSWLRGHAGGGSNMISKGVRAGVTLLPFGSGPSATLEAGHYFDGDANGLARKFAGSSFQSALLERVGYDYANAHLGLDFGSRRATFYIHGGMSYVRARIHNVDSVLAAEAVANGADSGTTEVSVKQDPIVRAWFPSVKLGLIVYLW